MALETVLVVGVAFESAVAGDVSPGLTRVNHGHAKEVFPFNNVDSLVAIRVQASNYRLHGVVAHAKESIVVTVASIGVTMASVAGGVQVRIDLLRSDFLVFISIDGVESDLSSVTRAGLQGLLETLDLVLQVKLSAEDVN